MLQKPLEITLPKHLRVVAVPDPPFIYAIAVSDLEKCAYYGTTTIDNIEVESFVLINFFIKFFFRKVLGILVQCKKRFWKSFVVLVMPLICYRIFPNQRLIFFNKVGINDFN